MQGPLVPEIDVLINGARVPAKVLECLQEVAVEDSVELPSMFTFAISSWDAVHLNPSWVDDDRFSVGNVVDIRMGWGDKLSSLIIGEITALEAEFTGSALPLLNVRGYDRRHRLQRGRKTRTFLQKKDSDIAAQIGDRQQRQLGLRSASRSDGLGIPSRARAPHRLRGHCERQDHAVPADRKRAA